MTWKQALRDLRHRGWTLLPRRKDGHAILERGEERMTISAHGKELSRKATAHVRSVLRKGNPSSNRHPIEERV